MHTSLVLRSSRSVWLPAVNAASIPYGRHLDMMLLAFSSSAMSHGCAVTASTVVSACLTLCLLAGGPGWVGSGALTVFSAAVLKCAAVGCLHVRLGDSSCGPGWSCSGGSLPSLQCGCKASRCASARMVYLAHESMYSLSCSTVLSDVHEAFHVAVCCLSCAMIASSHVHHCSYP